jgi:hypothetical protein
MNPRAPHIHGTIKLHKQENPVSTIVNWKVSPGYKLVKHLNIILNNTLQLPNAFNVQNTNILAQSLNQIEINENTQLCSFDIENMYTNIPTYKVKNTAKAIINNNNNISKKMKKEIIGLLNVILEQNYIQHNGQ